MTCEYPVYEVERITCDFGLIADYFGIAMVKVLAPTSLGLPLLGCKDSTGRLIFSLCNVCKETKQPTCDHTIEERAFVGCWATPELEEAVRLGEE